MYVDNRFLVFTIEKIALVIIFSYMEISRILYMAPSVVHQDLEESIYIPESRRQANCNFETEILNQKPFH